MIRIELTKETEHFPVGAVICVDENSARVLVKRGDAKRVGEAVPEVVESGGERARAINAAAKTEGDNPPEASGESSVKAVDSK